jgi:quercetin dioxygenase-like cupin family protein
LLSAGRVNVGNSPTSPLVECTRPPFVSIALVHSVEVLAGTEPTAPAAREAGRKGEDTMSSGDDQARKEALLNAGERAASLTFAHEPGEGEALWWFGSLATIKATGEQTDARYALVEILVPDGYESVLHVHHFEDEGFYILKGEMTFYVDDRTIKAHPGSFLFDPKDVPHAFTVDSGPAKLLFIFTPAGLGNGIRGMREPARSLTVPPQPEEPPDEAEMERLAAIGARYGVEILGPPPNQ